MTLIVIPHRTTDLALKAESHPPLWWRDSVHLQSILRSAWHDVAADFQHQLREAFLSQSTGKIERLVDQLPEIGSKFAREAHKLSPLVFKNLHRKSHMFWALHAKQVGIDTGIALKSDYSRRYQDLLVSVSESQFLSFVRANPERILHPEIERQLGHMEESRLTGAGDVVRIEERLNRLLERQDRYFEGLSSAHVARVWHNDGVLIAAENGVATLRGTGPQDQKTCPVCMNLLGIEIPVEAAKQKVMESLEITDIEEYRKLWSFPEIKDVDNVSREQMLQNVGPLPFPAHNRCRHGYRWSSMVDGKRLVSREPRSLPAEAGLTRVGLMPILGLRAAATLVAGLSRLALASTDFAAPEIPEQSLVQQTLRKALPTALKAAENVSSKVAVLSTEEIEEIIQTATEAIEEAKAVSKAPTKVLHEAIRRGATAAAREAGTEAERIVFEALPRILEEARDAAIEGLKDGIPFATTLTTYAQTVVTSSLSTLSGGIAKDVLPVILRAARKEVLATLSERLGQRNDPTAMLRGLLPFPPDGKNWRWIPGQKLKAGGIGKGYWRLVKNPNRYIPIFDPKASELGMLPGARPGTNWRWMARVEMSDGRVRRAHWRQIKIKKGLPGALPPN